MDLHLLATDVSVLEIADALPESDSVSALIVPQNRIVSAKVSELKKQAPWPIFEHARQEPLPSGLPPAETAVSWFYSQILAPEDLQQYGRGILNMHGGKIPEYRGANVLQWAIINGETELGITWHEMAEEVDAGAIWHETTIPIPDDATALDMRKAMIEAAIDTFPTAWRRFCGQSVSPRIPDLSFGHVWPQRRERDSLIEQGMTEVELQNQIRALCSPWPRPFVEINGEKVEIDSVSTSPTPDGVPYKCSDGKDVYLTRANGVQ